MEFPCSEPVACAITLTYPAGALLSSRLVILLSLPLGAGLVVRIETDKGKAISIAGAVMQAKRICRDSPNCTLLFAAKSTIAAEPARHQQHKAKLT